MIEDYHTAYMRYHFSKYSGLIKQGTYKVSASMPLDTVLGVLAGDAKTTEDADSIEASAGVLEDELSDDTQGGE